MHECRNGQCGRFKWCIDCGVLSFDGNGLHEEAIPVVTGLIMLIVARAPDWYAARQDLSEIRDDAMRKHGDLPDPLGDIFRDFLNGLDVMVTERSVGQA